MASQLQAPAPPPLPNLPRLAIADCIDRLEQGGALLLDSPQNLMEVVGILDSYGVVLNAYAVNLKYVADHQFLVFFPFFKYFNGEITPQKLLRHLWHDRINYEYAEYCMRGMLWHGDCPFAQAMESEAFNQLALAAIEARIRNRPLLQLLHRLFPEFLLEQARMMTYTSILGQFWTIMSEIFCTLADRYNRGEITSIPQVTDHIREGLVANAAQPITYAPLVRGKPYDLLPLSAGYTFLVDTGIPYVEAIFFRGTPFMGTMSYNAQQNEVPDNPGEFDYGALFADPLPIGGSGIPPTLLMQDMSRHLPDYLAAFYKTSKRNGLDLRVQICESFQRSMFCVTTAAIQGLAPHPLTTQDEAQRLENRAYLKPWLERMAQTRLARVNATAIADQDLSGK
jgi:CO2 hydration protein